MCATIIAIEPISPPQFKPKKKKSEINNIAHYRTANEQLGENVNGHEKQRVHGKTRKFPIFWIDFFFVSFRFNGIAGRTEYLYYIIYL